MNGRDDFYVGWQDEAPADLRRFTRRVALLAAIGVALAAALLAASQQPMADGRFEYGVAPRWTGRLVASPILMLQDATRDDAPAAPARTLVLVGMGKHGAPAELMQLDGRRVTLRGSLVAREGDVSMLEVRALESSDEATPSRGASEDLGPATLVGELVDTKCWLGVMRPATGKVHRACAARCLSGGVPPGLLVRLGDGDAVTVLLVAGDGTRLGIAPRLAARELRCSGDLERRDGVLVLRAGACSLLDDTTPTGDPT